MVDVSLVPEAAWREARRRAEVIRPLVESTHRSLHFVQAPAATLGPVRAADQHDPAALPRGRVI